MEIVKRYFDKVVIVFLVVSAVALWGSLVFGSNTAQAAGIADAVVKATTGVTTDIKTITNNAVVKILVAIEVVILLFCIGKAGMKYRSGQDMELGAIIGLIICIALTASFPVWGASLF